jgi:ribose/xylose/arabinose/galactoside ABC-type transport system permease subunit
MIVVLIGLVIVTQVLYPGFLKPANLRNVLEQIAPTGLVAVGMTFVIISGAFDLSVGATYALGATLFAKFWLSQPTLWMIVPALLAGMAGGLINGLLVTRLKINAFVATLGTGSIFSGLAYLWSNSTPIVVSDPRFLDLGTGQALGLPYAVWIMLIVVAAGGIVLARTTFGRAIYAVGGNAEASRLAGMRVDAIRVTAFVIVGALAALAGCLLASTTGVGQGDYGATVALDSISIVIIGGTSFAGGEGAMWRTAVGILIIGTLNNLFDSLALSTYMQSLAKGLVVVAAVSLDSWSRRFLR